MFSRGKLMVQMAKNSASTTKKSKVEDHHEFSKVIVQQIGYHHSLNDDNKKTIFHYNTPLIRDSPQSVINYAGLEYQDNRESGDPYESSDDYVPPTDIESSSTSANESEQKVMKNLEETPNIGIEGDINKQQQNETENVYQMEIQPKRKLKQFPHNPKTSRKRVRRPETWKRVKAALDRQAGRSYFSQSGYTVPEKTASLQSLCSENCKLKCSSKFDIELKNSIFNEFYKLDVNAKNALLFKSIVGRPTKRTVKDAKKHKSFSYDYIITRSNQQIKVCKTAFCALFQISRKKIEVIQKKLQTGASAPSPDRQGRHSNRPHRLADNVVQYVMDHIKKFPAESSHYSRNSNPYRMFLSPRLTMSIMYKLYLEECKKDDKPIQFIIKKSTYANIFCTKFNLSFNHPQSDTCSQCDSGEATEEHNQNVTDGFNLMRADRESARNNEKVLYLTVDLQQTMPLPKLTTSKAFYLRQLWFYNLGVHSISTHGDQLYMQTWTEDIAGRGSNEVASCLWNFIQNYTEVNNTSHLIIWSDSCSGQNKNFQMISFYQFLIFKGIFETIDHKFPEVGHTYLDSDRDFGRIEKILRKNGTVYTPQQYRELIKQGSIKNAVITDMEHHFHNFAQLAGSLGLVHTKKNTLNEKVNFRDGIKWIRVDKFGSYMYKESYDPYTPFKEVSLLKNKNASKVSIRKDVDLTRIRNKTGNISEKKLINIKDQIKYVPEQHRWFYEQFFPEEVPQETSKLRHVKKKKTN